MEKICVYCNHYGYWTLYLNNQICTLSPVCFPFAIFLKQIFGSWNVNPAGTSAGYKFASASATTKNCFCLHFFFNKHNFFCFFPIFVINTTISITDVNNHKYSKKIDYYIQYTELQMDGCLVGWYNNKNQQQMQVNRGFFLV